LETDSGMRPITWLLDLQMVSHGSTLKYLRLCSQLYPRVCEDKLWLNYFILASLKCTGDLSV